MGAPMARVGRPSSGGAPVPEAARDPAGRRVPGRAVILRWRAGQPPEGMLGTIHWIAPTPLAVGAVTIDTRSLVVVTGSKLTLLNTLSASG